MDQAAFPAIEANQGFLSLIALCAALGIAVFEFIRAERSASAVIKQEVNAALWPLERLLHPLASAEALVRDGEQHHEARLKMNHAITETVRLLEAVKARTLVPLLAVNLELATNMLLDAQIAGPDASSVRSDLAMARTTIIAARTTIAEVAKR